MFKPGYLKKKYGLIAASVMLLVLSYELAFKKTIEAWQINRQLKTQLTQSSDVSYQPGYQERKNANLDKIVNLYKADTINFRSNIISTISFIAGQENVKLSEVPTQDPIYHTPQFIVQKLSFEGDYFSLIKTINRLQLAEGIGIVRSMALKTIAKHPGNDENRKLILEGYLECRPIN